MHVSNELNGTFQDKPSSNVSPVNPAKLEFGNGEGVAVMSQQVALNDSSRSIAAINSVILNDTKSTTIPLNEVKPSFKPRAPPVPMRSVDDDVSRNQPIISVYHLFPS